MTCFAPVFLVLQARALYVEHHWKNPVTNAMVISAFSGIPLAPASLQGRPRMDPSVGYTDVSREMRNMIFSVKKDLQHHQSWA
jgi:hypothetical protein